MNLPSARLGSRFNNSRRDNTAVFGKEKAKARAQSQAENTATGILLCWDLFPLEVWWSWGMHLACCFSQNEVVIEDILREKFCKVYYKSWRIMLYILYTIKLWKFPQVGRFYFFRESMWHFIDHRQFCSSVIKQALYAYSILNSLHLQKLAISLLCR